MQVTGRSLIVRRRVQVNFWVHPLRTVLASQFLNPNGTTVPLMWYQEVSGGGSPHSVNTLLVYTSLYEYGYPYIVINLIMNTILT